MRYYEDLLTKIDEYQMNNIIPYRNVTIIVLIRLVLHHQSNPSNMFVEEIYGKKTPSDKHLNISYLNLYSKKLINIENQITFPLSQKQLQH